MLWNSARLFFLVHSKMSRTNQTGQTQTGRRGSSVFPLASRRSKCWTGHFPCCFLPLSQTSLRLKLFIWNCICLDCKTFVLQPSSPFLHSLQTFRSNTARVALVRKYYDCFFSSILHANKTHLQTKRFCTKTRFEIEAQANWLIDLSVSYRSHLFSSLGHTKFRATIKIAKFSGNFK